MNLMLVAAKGPVWFRFGLCAQHALAAELICLLSEMDLQAWKPSRSSSIRCKLGWSEEGAGVVDVQLAGLDGSSRTSCGRCSPLTESSWHAILMGRSDPPA